MQRTDLKRLLGLFLLGGGIALVASWAYFVPGVILVIFGYRLADLRLANRIKKQLAGRRLFKQFTDGRVK